MYQRCIYLGLTGDRRASIHTTIVELGLQNHTGDGLFGPNSIMVICVYIYIIWSFKAGVYAMQVHGASGEGTVTKPKALQHRPSKIPYPKDPRTHI